VAASIVARFLLEPLVGDAFPFGTFYPAVLFAAWYGGWWPGLVALALSAVATAWLVVPPVDSLAIRDASDRVGMVLFVLFGLTTTVLSEAQRAAQRREAAARRAAEVAADRTTTLQSLTAALSQALTQEQVAEAAVQQAVSVLGARVGGLGLLNPERDALLLIRASGYPPEAESHWQHVPLDRAAAPTEAVRTGLPIWIHSRGMLLARYPGLANTPLGNHEAFAALPLRVEGRAIGVLTLGFAEARSFEDEEQTFLLALAQQCAQAMDRARLYEAERTARAEAEAAERRLSFLAEASAVFASSLEYEQTLQSVAEMAIPHIADGCVVDMIRDDGRLHRVAVAHPDQRKVQLIWEVDRRTPLDPAAPYGPARVIRTGAPELLAEITPEQLRAASRDPDHLRLLQELGMTSHLIVPLVSQQRVLGSITFAYLESGRHYRAADLPVAEEVARRAAVAIENARLYRETQTARAASESERDRLQQVLNQLPEGVLIADATRRFIIGNAAAGAIFGRDLVGQLLAPTDTHAQDAFGARWLDGTPMAAQQLPLQRSLADGEIVQGEQIVIHNATEDRDIPLLVNSAPLRDANGAIIGAVLAFQDITAIKDYERSREDFLSALSHDLRTPITSIRGMAQVLLRRASRMEIPESTRMTEGLKTIEAATGKMSAMLTELLDLARLQSGRSLELQKGPVDLVALARRTAEEFQRTATGHEIRVETALPALVGQWDAVRLERVLGNLLSNAVKYSPEGGVIIVQVNQDTEGAETEAVLSVRDDGIGIPAADLPRVFERFHRAANVTGRIAGTGIGLAGSRQIVEQHGGTIAVESTEGAGSTFIVRLPLR
jgi:K+-sensing histidine kinase KdpD